MIKCVQGLINVLFQTLNCDDSVDTTVFLVVLSIGAAIGVTYLLIGVFINRIGKKTLLIGKYRSPLR